MRLFCTLLAVLLLPWASRAATETYAEPVIESSEDVMPMAKLVVDEAVPAKPATASSPNSETMQPPNEAAVVEKLESARKVAESEIPVLTEKKAEKKSDGSAFQRLMITLGVFAAALCGILFGLKRWSGKRGNSRTNPKIKVLTQHALGSKKSLAIIQVAGESILIGVTDNNINMIKTLALIDDEVPEHLPNNFDNAFVDYDEPERLGPASRKLLPPVEREDFTMQGLGEIRDKVSTRLKNMKHL